MCWFLFSPRFLWNPDWRHWSGGKGEVVHCENFTWDWSSGTSILSLSLSPSSDPRTHSVLPCLPPASPGSKEGHVPTGVSSHARPALFYPLPVGSLPPFPLPFYPLSDSHGHGLGIYMSREFCLSPRQTDGRTGLPLTPFPPPTGWRQAGRWKEGRKERISI